MKTSFYKEAEVSKKTSFYKEAEVLEWMKPSVYQRFLKKTITFCKEV